MDGAYGQAMTLGTSDLREELLSAVAQLIDCRGELERGLVKAVGRNGPTRNRGDAMTRGGCAGDRTRKPPSPKPLSGGQLGKMRAGHPGRISI